MVSRSLEKMMLIAIGLTTVVLVGVPVLLYSINTINAVSNLERAQTFAQQLHNATAEVDQLRNDSISLELFLPDDVQVVVNDRTLTVSYHPPDGTVETWSHGYNHTLALTPPSESGTYLVTVRLNSGTIEIIFSSL